METMDIEQLANYLRRDAREVGKLASRGQLPGRKVGGEWRFNRAEINRWLEDQLPELSDSQLTSIETAHGEDDPLLAGLLSACGRSAADHEELGDRAYAAGAS